MSLTKAQEFFAWPPKCCLNFYSKDTKGRFSLDLSSSSRLFDLSDNIGPEPPYKSRTIYLGVSTESPKWGIWDESNLQKIEWRIKYDLNFDGYQVTINRIDGPKSNSPCTGEFLWKLTIRERY